MSFAKGLMLIASFSFVWGALTGINVAVLQGAADLPFSVFSLFVSAIVALLEALALLGLVDRYLLRKRLDCGPAQASHERTKVQERKGGETERCS